MDGKLVGLSVPPRSPLNSSIPQATHLSTSPHPVSSAPLPRHAKPRGDRGQLFAREIGDHGFGPFGRIRGDLYDVMEDVLTEPAGPSRTLTQLAAETVGRARDRVAPPSIGPGPSWDQVRHFLAKLVGSAAVVLDANGNPIRGGFAGLRQPVASLADGWRDRCEETLVLAAVNVVHPTEDDLPALAFALFNNDRDGLERLNDILGRLFEAGRIVEEQGKLHQTPIADTPS